MLAYYLTSVFEISFFEYFFQLIAFFSFLSLVVFKHSAGNKNMYFELASFFTFFGEIEDSVSDLEFDFFTDNVFDIVVSRFTAETLNLSFNSQISDFFSSQDEYQHFDDFAGDFLAYTEFFDTEGLDFGFDFFDFFIAILGLYAIVFFFNELNDEETDTILNFIQIGLTFLTGNSDLFTLFLGFEFLTISFVLGILLMQEKYTYSKSLIIYFVLSVAVSLVIFFFVFFIILLCTNSSFFSFLNFSSFFFDLSNQNEFCTDIFLEHVYNLCVKIFFLNLIVLFMFKFTVGPMALWTIFIYPTFPIIMLILQMLFFKLSLYFLFLEIFDYVFLFNFTVIDFFFKIFSFTLILSMFIGCFAYKINDLKTIFVITTFSQIAYVSLGFLTPSFLLLVYSLNYFLLYIYSTLAIFLIFIVANIVYNCQSLQDLAVLKYLDFGLYSNFLCLIFSMSGLPPFIGFFVKYFLLIKILTNPFLFKFGFILLLTSFITMYIYLSVIYNLIKTPNFGLLTLNFGCQKKSMFALPTFVEELFTFCFNSSILGFVTFLLSPFFFLFVPETDDFLEFFYDWNFMRLFEILEYYFE